MEAPGSETNPVCALATLAYLGAMYADQNAQARYQAAYDAYILKRAEYTAWDNQAKADNVYTWAEQSKLNELGGQLWTLETAMKAAKSDYDEVHKAMLVAATAMGIACLL